MNWQEVHFAWKRFSDTPTFGFLMEAAQLGVFLSVAVLIIILGFKGLSFAGNKFIHRNTDSYNRAKTGIVTEIRIREAYVVLNQTLTSTTQTTYKPEYSLQYRSWDPVDNVFWSRTIEGGKELSAYKPGDSFDLDNHTNVHITRPLCE